MKNVLLVILLTPALLFGQSKKQKKAMAAREKENLQIAADIRQRTQSLQSFNGDGTITNLDAVATYLSNQFKAIGLSADTEDGFIKTSFINEGMQITDSSFLSVNGRSLLINTEFFPLPFSALKKCTGMPAMALHERNLPWFSDIKLIKNQKSSDGGLYPIIAAEAERAATKGATALIIFTTDSTISLSYNRFDTTPQASIPVVYITPAGLKKYFSDQSDLLDIELNVSLRQQQFKVVNVCGFIDRKATSTAIITAPMAANTLSGSLMKADSFYEVASLIELAKMITKSGSTANNYLFIAGNNISTAVLNAASGIMVNYLINLSDLHPSKLAGGLSVEGIRTANEWVKIMDQFPQNSLTVKRDSTIMSSIFSSSDTIPQLTFTTTAVTTTDATPTLPASVVRYIYDITSAADGLGKLTYVKPETPTINKASVLKNSPAATSKALVSFGIIADESYDGTGLKLKALTPKKTGAAIGLKPGDVLINLGAYNIADYKSYLQILNQFKPGDTATLKIKRDNQDKEFTVVF